MPAPTTQGPSDSSRVLKSMLDRLTSAIMTGPGMNCRPHNSRQRIDLDSLKNLQGKAPALVLKQLLTVEASSSIESSVTAPKSAQAQAARRFGRTKLPTSDSREAMKEETETDKKQRQAWNDQQSVLKKLHIIAGEAQTYENDTGVDILHLGFPLISIPPGIPGPDGQPSTRRVLAPICFMPISIAIRTGGKTTLELSCTNEDIDRVQPNQALMSWVEQCTGKRPEPLYADESGENPWKEVCELVRVVAGALKVEVPEHFLTETPPDTLPLLPTPRPDALGDKPSILSSAVLGLFPVSNQGLLRDTREMMEQKELAGPVRSFVKHAATAPDAPTQGQSERLVAACDPCQARAVELARSSPVLVIHGPPGTGKSQTITNIIGDHLSRGERVLFVCDKRTAVDVVANRLEALGLGTLVAVVHDPQRDQKPLYMSIRAQLDGLTEATTRQTTETELERMDTELASLLEELAEYHRGLMQVAPGQEVALSELIGRWLFTRSPAAVALKLDDSPLREVSQGDCDRSTVQLRELFDRAAAIDYSANPWRAALSSTLDGFMAVPVSEHREALSQCCALAGSADKEFPVQTSASELALIPDQPVAAQAQARTDLAAGLRSVVAGVDHEICKFWAGAAPNVVAAGHAALAAVRGERTHIDSLEMVAQVFSSLSTANTSVAELSMQILAIEQYLPVAKAWWGFLAVGKKSAAGKVLAPLGLQLSEANAAVALQHLLAFRAAAILDSAVSRATGTAQARLEPQQSLARFESHLQAAALLHDAAASPLTACCAGLLRRELGMQVSGVLQQSAKHLHALTALETRLKATKLLSDKWISATLCNASTTPCVSQAVKELELHFETLDDCLRISDTLETLPRGIAQCATKLVEIGAPTASAMSWISLGVLAGEIARRLDGAPRLKMVDSRRIETLFTRVRELDAKKRELCREAVLHLWTSRCRERLLAGTGTRLNSDGAAVKQRLFVKGSKALRLRQVIAMGAQSEGGDPLMDLRPVWMASPETVAQLFPRTPVFDAVIFDEASQVRLEEALPVLTRGKRIIIAGDPKQLPPTRFFESTITEGQSEATETDAELFEQVQADTEDLLSAALSMDVQQSYLDVHYRSRCADLIEFSNYHFYSSRLQAIPGHPSRKPALPPLRLVAVDGVYEERMNEVEAHMVVTLVKDLLERKSPPSIGIGCFNVTQRDLISELLDEAAEEDEVFGKKLAEARVRRSSKSFEGLFVKNLENVQGDERDHIIISTTYGPDANGKFYRRFGPLAQPGGGRRLNVLVTRAREEVHVVTSIPAGVYRALPPVPEGSSPGGAWLLFSYLKFAEDLASEYSSAATIQKEHTTAGLVTRQSSSSPSALPEALAHRLAERSELSSTVYWGNEGFRIDVATPSPESGAGNPLGILADFSRFSLAGDPVKWDIFRSETLSQLGWQVQRVWSPSLVRDPEGVLEMLSQKARL